MTVNAETRILDANQRIWTGTFPDGSQLLVTEWLHDDGTYTVTAATRPVADPHCTWGPPIELETS